MLRGYVRDLNYVTPETYAFKPLKVRNIEKTISVWEIIPSPVSSENTIYGGDRLQGSLARLRSPEVALKTTFDATTVSSPNTET